ncbi:hypothetical protein H5T58_00685 [Candidatus Parcubacteria bacterium]|nr:hypothetical protein [Candidatus Parcubacteria bacterium]
MEKIEERNETDTKEKGKFQDLMRLLRQKGKEALKEIENLVDPALSSKEKERTLTLLRLIALSILNGEKASGQYYELPLPKQAPLTIKLWFSKDRTGFERIAKSPSNLTPDGIYHTEVDGEKVPPLVLLVSWIKERPKAGAVVFVKGKVMVENLTIEEIDRIIEEVEKYFSF